MQVTLGRSSASMVAVNNSTGAVPESETGQVKELLPTRYSKALSSSMAGQ